MSATLILQYPELILATILGLVLLPWSLASQEGFHAPAWLGEGCASWLQVMPGGYLNYLSKKLIWSNWRSQQNMYDFAALKVGLACAMLLLLFLLSPPVVLSLMVIGFFVPDLVLMVCVTRRQKAILESLPQALDLMVLCVDAGLGLDATLKRIATEETSIASALNDELKLLGRDILLGMDRERAYQELYHRTGVDELKTLGSALNQAGKLGLGIARILRAQSEYMRKKQSQKAEERALKLPVLMSFPLWFCIMPALLLLVLGPSLIRFSQSMGAFQ